MSEKLWFISDGRDVIAVFDDYGSAQEELFYLTEEESLGQFKVYGLPLTELENYSNEYDLAFSEGYIHYHLPNSKIS